MPVSKEVVVSNIIDENLSAMFIERKNQFYNQVKDNIKKCKIIKKDNKAQCCNQSEGSVLFICLYCTAIINVFIDSFTK